MSVLSLSCVRSLAPLAVAVVCFWGSPAWAQTCEVELVPFDGNGNENHGGSLAFDGARLVAGAPGERGASVLEILGAAYVYGPTGPGGSWQHLQKLAPATLEQRDRFATSLAMDGDTLAVGAPGEIGTFQFGPGKVYVYRETSPGQWTEDALLTSSDGAIGDRFGFSVAVDGDWMILGAPNQDEGGGDAGAAYVFRRTGGVWNEVQKILRPTGASGRGFGTSVAIDGDRACIGGPSLTATAFGAGGVFLFERDASGTYVLGGSVQGATLGLTDNYGVSLALEGDTLLVGATRDDDGGSDAGAVYAFEFDGASGTFLETAKFVHSLAESGDRFGSSIALQGDLALVGAPGHSLGGAAITLSRQSGGPWSESRTTVPTEATNGNSAGAAVALAGPVAAIGNPGASPIVFLDGAVYLTDVTLADADGNGVSDVCENWWQVYCTQTVPNSTGAFALMTASGSPVASDQTLSLQITQLPAFQFGLLVSSQTQGLIPTPGGSQGDLCLGGTIGRYGDLIAGSSGGGVLNLDVPIGAMPAPLPPAILSGETWNFQLWHRDSNPTPTANFSDAIVITFL